MNNSIEIYSDHIKVREATNIIKNSKKSYFKEFDYVEEKDFEDKIPLSIDFIFNVNDLKTEKEVLQWYVDMNAGGTPHTSEEINRVKKMIEKL